MIIGVYRKGASVLHRLPAGVKLAGLAGLSAVVFVIADVESLGALLLAALAALALARPDGASLRAGLVPVLPMLAIILALQLWFDTAEVAVVTCLRLAILATAAFAVSLTTRTDDLLALLIAGLRRFERFGVEPERVALAVSLALRFVPLMLDTLGEMRLAARARGVERLRPALIGAFVVRILRFAEDVADALDLRGIGGRRPAPGPGPGD